MPEDWKKSVEESRLALDRERFEREKEGPWYQRSSVLVTAFVSLAVTLTTTARGCYQSKSEAEITKQELEITRRNSDLAADRWREEKTNRKSEENFRLRESERQSQLELAKFAVEHSDDLVGGGEKFEVIKMLILTGFPSKVSKQFFERYQIIQTKTNPSITEAIASASSIRQSEQRSYEIRITKFHLIEGAERGTDEIYLESEANGTGLRWPDKGWKDMDSGKTYELDNYIINLTTESGGSLTISVGAFESDKTRQDQFVGGVTDFYSGPNFPTHEITSTSRGGDGKFEISYQIKDTSNTSE